METNLVEASLIFSGSSLLVVLAGFYLAKYGDALASLMGWGRLWAGTILLAGATSLPELITSLTAASRDDTGLAVGNIFGSSMVNMLVLALVALGGASFFHRVSPEQRTLVLVAMGLTGLALLLGAFHMDLSVLKVGLPSVLILAAYLAGMRLVYVTRPVEEAREEVDRSRSPTTLRRAWVFFGLSALVVILAAQTLTNSAEDIAESTGLATSFLGVVVVALVTTFPEAATTIAAVRLGSIDLGVGNLYGSCAFNIMVLGLADPFYRRGTLVESLDEAHLAAGLVAVALMGLGLTQIITRSKYRYLPARPIWVAMAMAYAGGGYAVYQLS